MTKDIERDCTWHAPLPPPRESTRWAWAMLMLAVLWVVGFFFGMLFWMASRGFVPPLS